MPKYTFKCESGHTVQKIVSAKVREIECNHEGCTNSMCRQPPRLQQSDVEETIDKYFGTKQRPDQKDVVQQRRDEFYWTVEVPRLVNSGTYTVETMLEMGWIYLDVKNQVQINNKPPNKR